MVQSVLEELIAGASGDDVRVATLLRKVKVVAFRLGTPRLDEWVEHELNGYPEGVDLPDYRALRDAEVRGNFTGPFGSSITGGIIPPSSLRGIGEHVDSLFQVAYPMPISELESLIDGRDDVIKAQWPADVVSYVNGLLHRGEIELYEGMFLNDAYRTLPVHSIVAILDRVRTRILDLALALESVSPAVGRPELPVEQRDAAQGVVLNMFGGSANIALGPHSVQTSNAVIAGDLKSLHAALRALGIGEEQIDALDLAIDADGDEPMGGGVRGWIGDRTLEAASSGSKTAGTEVVKLAARAVATYFGLPV